MIPLTEDDLWLCNTASHNRYGTHDYCLVHEVAFPTGQGCPGTLDRIHRIVIAARP